MWPSLLVLVVPLLLGQPLKVRALLLMICEKPSQVLGVFGPQTALIHRRLQRLVGVGTGGEQNPCRASWLMQQVVLVQDYNVAHEILVAERAEKGFDPVKVVVPQLWCLLRTRSEGPLGERFGLGHREVSTVIERTRN
jgi:hypothetical protein